MAKSKTERTVLVTGATGQQGGAVARHLVERGFAVRGLVRDPGMAEARKLVDKGVEVVRGDFDDRASLVKALDGVYGCFSVQSPQDAGVEGEVRQGKAVADAARGAGVRHFVYTSVAGADQHTGIPHFESKTRIEEHIRNLGMVYTILRPVFFMENWLSMADMIASGDITLPLSPGLVVPQIAVDDIGGIAATAFEHTGRWQNRIMEIAGDEATQQNAAALFSRAAGHAVRYVQMPWGQFEQSAGPDMTTMYHWFETHGYHVDIGAVRSEYPRLTTLANWIDRQNWQAMAGGAPQRA